MNLVVAVLTFQQFASDRHGLFKRTLRSLAVADVPVVIVDNGSTDGTSDYVKDLGGYVSRTANTTVGAGMNLAIDAAVDHGADVVVFSNDDIEWRDDWRDHVEAFWSDPPDNVAICSGLLEPEYPWNTIRGHVDYPLGRALWRDTAPGGAWTLTAEHWRKHIRPVPDVRVDWSDVPTCLRLGEEGYRVCQADWASHLGEDRSLWGNGSYKWAKTLDRAAWGV